LNITSLLLVVLFEYTALLISYTHNGDDTHKKRQKRLFKDSLNQNTCILIFIHTQFSKL